MYVYMREFLMITVVEHLSIFLFTLFNFICRKTNYKFRCDYKTRAIYLSVLFSYLINISVLYILFGSVI